MPEEVLPGPPAQEAELRGCELPHHSGAKKWSPVPKRLLRGFIHTSPCPRAPRDHAPLLVSPQRLLGS